MRQILIGVGCHFVWADASPSATDAGAMPAAERDGAAAAAADDSQWQFEELHQKNKHQRVDSGSE